jgi:hypothetical protein
MKIEQSRLDSLSTKEKEYLDFMIPKSGVLYVKSKPGMAKSAIMRSIAKKLGFQFFDIRLSMVDETDVGLYPNVETIVEKNETLSFLKHVVPYWAHKANQSPSIINFEELNRAPLSVRNAALQILLEREIGTEFKFNDNVLMCATGNLGEEDGTDVEEFDAALNNRLIHIEHDLTAKEWIESFANEHVCKHIVNFIHSNPEEMYKIPGKNNKGNAGIPVVYATPRSWTFLSDFIKHKLGGKDEADKATNISQVKDVVAKYASFYIGVSQTKFLRYLEDTMQLNIFDIIRSFDEKVSKLKTFNRDRKSELLHSLKELDLDVEITKDFELNNIVKFINLLDEDEQVAYLTFIIDKNDNDKMGDINSNYTKLLHKFSDLLVKISNLS